MNSEPVTLQTGELDIREYSYRKVKLIGIFENIHLRVFAGKNGYYLVQPMKIEKNKYILVNRGTFSEENISVTASGSPQEIAGTVYCKFKSMTKWIAKNSPKQNLWFWYDIEKMSRYLGIPLEKCIIWGDGTATHGSTKANAPLQVRNDHLGYAITWYTLAVTWVVGYVIYVRRYHL